MSGLFGSLGVGVSGLSASQNSINTTSHNLVNANTEAFVRQNTVQTDRVYANMGLYGAGISQVGKGSNLAAVTQIRDVFLDRSYRREYGRQGFYQAQYEAMEEVEELFGELEGVQYQNVLENFWASIQELQKEPDSVVTRASLVQSALNFMERSDSIYTQLVAFQQDLNTKVYSTVKRINEIGEQMSELNGLIQKYESGMERANDYRDQRNELLDELGNLVNITYHEYEDGFLSVSIEGHIFLTDYGVNKMQVSTMDNKLGVYQPIWGENGDPVFNFDLPCTSAANTDIGYLKGLLVARGDMIGNYTDIPVEPDPELYRTDPDDEDEDMSENEAYQRAMAEYRSGVERYNNVTANSVIMKVQAQFDKLVHGIVTKINDILSPTLTGTWESGGQIIWRDRQGNVVAEEDVPEWTSSDLEDYAIEELDEEGEGTGRFTIRILDTKNAGLGMDADATIGEALFNRKSEARFEVIEDLGDEPLYVYRMEQSSDWYSMFSLGEIEVNLAIRDDLALLPLSRNNGTGDYDMDTAAALATVWDEDFATLDPNTLTKNNFLEYYTAFTSDVANTGQKLRAIRDNQEETANGVDDQRQQVMGVSSDEELTHLLKFQHSYNAASRYITVVDEMLEHLLNALG